MSRLGLGLLAATPPPPLRGSMITFVDARFGVTESGGLVSAIASRIGGAVFTAAGASRPAYGGGGRYLEFDGVDDFLSRAADTESHPTNVPVFTWAGWTWRTGSALAVVYSSVPLFTASGGVLVQDNAGVSRQYYPNSTGNWNIGSSLPLGSWVFRAAVYNAAAALGSRMQVYEGATPVSLALVAPGSDTCVGNTGPAAGTSCIGRDADLGRYFPGRLAAFGQWTAGLSLPQLQAFALLTAPPGV